MSLFSMMAKGGTVVPDRPPAGRDPASLQAYPASRPEPGRDPASLKQYPPSDAMHPGSMDLSQPSYVSVTSGNSTSGYPTAMASGAVLKGPKVVVAGEAGPEAFVPLKDDGSMLPDPKKAKGPGMGQFLQALQAHGYQDNSTQTVANKPSFVNSMAQSHAQLQAKVNTLEAGLKALMKSKKRNKG